MLWRHGRTSWNAQRRFQGHSDVELDEVGLAQAQATASQLALLKPDKIVSSDLLRANVTANALATLVDLPVTTDVDLRETRAGRWEGLTRPELERKYGDELAAWAAGSNLAPGGGERRSEVATRMMRAINRALDDVPAQGCLVIVTHGGSARAAIGSMLSLPVAHWGIFGVLTNCAWCVLTEANGRTDSLVDISSGPTATFPDVPPTPPWRLVEYNASSLPTEGLADDR